MEIEMKFVSEKCKYILKVSTCSIQGRLSFVFIKKSIISKRKNFKNKKSIFKSAYSTLKLAA